MMRPVSLLCMLLAVVSGLYLYRVKYRAQMLDREISTTLKAADDARARAGMLRADYALLNDPVRLQELVDLHLTLKTTQPAQFTTLADFERRLPPIGIAPPEPPAEPEIPAAVIRPEPRTPVPEPRLPEPRLTEPPRPPPVVAIARPAAPPPPPPALAMPPPVAAAPPVPPASRIAPVAPPAPPPAVAAVPRPPTPLGLPQQAAATPAATPSIPATPVHVPPPVTQVSVRSAGPPPAAPYRPALSPTPIAAPAAPAADNVPAAPRSALGMARRAVPSTMAPGGGGGN